MKIYITLPLTGSDNAERMAKATKYTKNIELLGHTPVGPFDVEVGLSAVATYADKVGANIAALLRSDAIFLCRGWEESPECNLMKSAADTYGLLKYTRLDQIPEE